MFSSQTQKSIFYHGSYNGYTNNVNTIFGSSMGGVCCGVGGGSSGGGRRAAAVALAAYGVGLKVSADGGIEGFRRTTTGSEGQVGTRMSFRLMK